MNLENTPKRVDSDSMPNHLRRAGINPNRWYMIAKSSDVADSLVAREIWQKPVVLFRSAGIIRALEDRCPHRLVRLSHGRIIDGGIECAYHGWRFDADGRCTYIPHLAAKPVLPDCAVRSFPVIERDGFVWIYPGDSRGAAGTAPMAMSEWDDVNEIRSVARLSCRAGSRTIANSLLWPWPSWSSAASTSPGIS
jgi:phenylpropionate dioxygenase-like ring-hydroxylating dioxygenase large terminal subunit